MRSCSNIEWKSSNNSWKMVEGFWNDSKWDKNWNMPFLQIRSSPSRLENKQCDPKKPIINECTWGSFWFKNAVGMSGCTRDPKSKEGTTCYQTDQMILQNRWTDHINLLLNTVLQLWDLVDTITKTGTKKSLISSIKHNIQFWSYSDLEVPHCSGFRDYILSIPPLK